MDYIEESRLKCEMIRKIWKKGKSNGDKIGTIWKKGKLKSKQIWKKMEEIQFEYWKDMENTEEYSEKIWKIQKKIGKWYGNYERKIS